jgi:hypothetical protein
MRNTVISRYGLIAGRVSAGALAVVLAASPAWAYCIKVCDGTKQRWDANDVYFHGGKKSFADSTVRAAMESARLRWNETPAFFNFHISYGWDQVGQHNGDNEIWFSTDQGILGGAPGLTLTWSDCETIEETDIVFDANWAYTFGTSSSSSSAYGGAFRTFRTVAIHELGHSLGLCHVNTTYNVMGDDSTFVNANGGTLRPYAGEDAINGQVSLYGIWPPSQYEDVSVSHWKYPKSGGKNGEYSVHVRTAVYDTSDNPLGVINSGGEPFYKVSKGQTVKVEFTYENNGRSPQNVDIAYVLSTNNLITTLDPLLATGNIPNLVRNGPFTTNNTFLTIPNSLVSGTKYYIGAIVNYNNKFTEFTGKNNATCIGIQVK